MLGGADSGQQAFSRAVSRQSGNTGQSVKSGSGRVLSSVKICLMLKACCACRAWLDMGGLRENLQQENPLQQPVMDVLNGASLAYPPPPPPASLKPEPFLLIAIKGSEQLLFAFESICVTNLLSRSLYRPTPPRCSRIQGSLLLPSGAKAKAPVG